MYLIKLLLFLNVGVLTLKAQDFSGGNNVLDENLKTVHTVVNHLNGVPEGRYLFLRGRYVDSQLKGDILQLIADFDVTCKLAHPGVPCQYLTLQCTSFLKKDNDEKDYKVLSYTCSPKDEVSAEQVEISPTLTAAQENVDNIELSHEAIYTDQKADFVAVKSSYAPCLGCPFDLNTNAEGVTTLINTALRHLESERDQKHSLVKVVRLQEQIVAGVKYILLIEVSPTICLKNSDSNDCPLDNNKAIETCEIVYFQKPWLSALKHIIKNNCTVSQEFSAGAETRIKERPQIDAKEVTSDFLSELESQIVPEPPQIVIPSNLRPYKPQSIPKINEVREPTETVPEYSPSYIANEEIATKQEDEGKVESITKDTNEIPQEYTLASNIEQRTEINDQDKIEENCNGQSRLKRDTDEDTNETEESNSSEIRRPKRSTEEDTNETEESNSYEIRRPKRDTDEDTNETEESDSSTIRRQKRDAGEDTDETNETTEEIEIRIKRKSHKSDSSSSSSSSDSDDDDDVHHHKSRKHCKNNDDSSSSSSSDSDDDSKSRNDCERGDDSSSSSSSDSDDDENDTKSRKHHKNDDDSSSSSSSDSDNDNDIKCRKHKKSNDDSSSSSSSSDSDDEDDKKNKISKKHDCKSDSNSSKDSCESDNHNGSDVKPKKHHVSDDKPKDTTEDDTNDIKPKKHEDDDNDDDNDQKTKKWPTKYYRKGYEQVEVTRKKRSTGDYEGMSEDDRLEVKKLAKIAAKMLNQSKSTVKVLSAEKINMDGSYYKLKLHLDSVCSIIMHIDRNSEISMVKSQCHNKEKFKNKKRYRRYVNMPGGIVPISVTPEVKGFINDALVYLDSQSTHPNKLKVIEILNASSQVVAGQMIRIEAKIAPSNCTKSDLEKDRDECGVLEEEPSKVCNFKIWNRPWLPKGRETTIDCSGEDKVHSFRSKRSLHFDSDEEIDWNTTRSNQFIRFIVNHKKTYKNRNEFNFRYRIFKDNLATIRLLNAIEQGTAVYGITKYADLTKREFSRMHGLRFDLRTENEVPFATASIPDVELPVEFDWRQKNAVTEVKNQGECGSCWAFSTTGNIEGQYAIKYNRLQEFSEQELVDCDTVDQGCNGGLMDNAYRVIEKLGGLELEKDYPYEAEDESCHFNKTMAKVKLNGALNISHDETDMAKWLVKNGPISIAINANAMQFYMGGVSHPWKVLCNPDNLDHGVLIVGYGIHKYSLFNKTLPYWIVKNSWGKDWGEQGYYRVYRGDGTCGLNQTPSSAIVA